VSETESLVISNKEFKGMNLPPIKSPIAIDGQMSDGSVADEIEDGGVGAYSVHARARGESFYFTIIAPARIGANTMIWLNTDENAASGFETFDLRTARTEII
jgi:hypothetical protein